MRLVNFNAYKLTPDQRGTEMWDARVTAIKETAPDILALQEVRIDERHTARERWDREAATVIQELAEQCGLTARVGATAGYPHGVAMAANSRRGWWTALLWNPETVDLIGTSYRPFGDPDFWHSCTTARFDIGAREPVLVGSYHGDPYRPDFRATEGLRLKGIYRRSGGPVAGFLLGDFNALSAARHKRRWWHLRGAYYDPEAYKKQRHDDLEFQVRAGTSGMLRRQLADRRQTAVLLREGYMVDAAAYLEAPWQPTVGHWYDGQGDPDPWGQRRIDLILATRPAAPALRSYTTHTSPAARTAADHLPVIAEVAPAAIGEP